ncbi:hypothetical protein [Anaerobacillus arseniciselenatis]|uniref:hypothetical protein n=1 Tax=Anaerobacillus arseniciselenatis TaxID=85682 RepID=UPI0011135767|nr:hypothetical protein [Anaerobacillus arseniciselenatis]
MVFLLFIAVMYGYKKHQEVSNQHNYLNPLLMEKVHAIQKEIHTASSILTTAMDENQIPYAQWMQLKNAYKTIEHASYEIEKMARAIYPNRAKGLENATKTTSYLMASDLVYIEDNFIEANLDRSDMITFSAEERELLEPIYNTTLAWRKISGQYYVVTYIITRKYWVDMMKEIQEESILYQKDYYK